MPFSYSILNYIFFILFCVLSIRLLSPIFTTHTLYFFSPQQHFDPQMQGAGIKELMWSLRTWWAL